MGTAVIGKQKAECRKRIYCLLLSAFCVLSSALHAQTPYTSTSNFSEKVYRRLSKSISLDLRKIDVLDVLKFLSTKADLNIVTSSNVNARVTLFLEDVAIGNALEVILISSGLAVKEKDGILYVMTEEEYTALYGQSYRDQRQIKIVQIRYTDPDKVGELLGGVKSSIGKIIIDKQTGTLILIDIEEKINLMEKMIRKVDIPTVERVLPTETAVFELNYNKAADLGAKVQTLLTDGVGTFQTDEKTNRIVVTDMPYAMDRIRALIEAFDRKTREVFIETKILQVRLSNEYEMGIDWEGVINEGKERKKYAFDLNGNFAISADTSRFGRAVIGNLGKKDFIATVDFVHSFGDVKTLAAPQLTVEHGKEATILVGTREAYVTSTVSQADSTTTTSESITFVDVGVQLKVTPTINEDGFVSLKVAPESSSVSRTLTTGNGNEIPIVDTTNASTEVTVKSGHTVLIGGLMKDEISKTINKIPMLGDLPFLGVMFRYTTDETVKTELVIFLTPEIVQGDELYPRSYSAGGKPMESIRKLHPAGSPGGIDPQAVDREVQDRIVRLRKKMELDKEEHSRIIPVTTSAA